MSPEFSTLAIDNMIAALNTLNEHLARLGEEALALQSGLSPEDFENDRLVSCSECEMPTPAKMVGVISSHHYWCPRYEGLPYRQEPGGFTL